MMTLRYYPHMQVYTKKAEEALALSTVGDALRHVKAAYGADALREAKASLIVVNNTSIELLKGRKTILRDGDTLAFLPLCGGG